MNKLTAYLISRYKNKISSFKTDRHIVIIESDDWGSIRTSNADDVQKLQRLGYNTNKSVYMKDSLETEEDLTMLFDVLNSNKSVVGSIPKFTANLIMTNPDFDHIKESGYKEYFHKSIQDFDCENNLGIIDKWRQGFKADVFIPEYHGREHVNWRLWLNDLIHSSEEALLTFEMGMCGVPLSVSKIQKSYYTHIYDTHYDTSSSINDGIKYYEQIFGLKPSSSVAPNVTWDDTFERELLSNGIRSIQSGYLQREIINETSTYYPRYTGQTNSMGQIYTVRNVTFEPSRVRSSNYWKNAHLQVIKAFSKKHPAIISTHRVNYMGSISTENRAHGLNQLNELLSAILRTYPNTEFLSTIDLFNLMHSEKFV